MKASEQLVNLEVSSNTAHKHMDEDAPRPLKDLEPLHTGHIEFAVDQQKLFQLVRLGGQPKEEHRKLSCKECRR